MKSIISTSENIGIDFSSAPLFYSFVAVVSTTVIVGGVYNIKRSLSSFFEKKEDLEELISPTSNLCDNFDPIIVETSETVFVDLCLNTNYSDVPFKIMHLIVITPWWDIPLWQLFFFFFLPLYYYPTNSSLKTQ